MYILYVLNSKPFNSSFFLFVVYNKFELHIGYSFLYFPNSFVAQCFEGSKPVELK